MVMTMSYMWNLWSNSLFLFYCIQNNNLVSAKTVVCNSMGSTNNIVAAGFLVVANILERIEDVRANQIECLSLLKEMTKLAKVVKEFKERANLRGKMYDEIKDTTTLIVKGCLMCCTQIDSSKFSKCVFERFNCSFSIFQWYKV